MVVGDLGLDGSHVPSRVVVESEDVKEDVIILLQHTEGPSVRGKQSENKHVMKTLVQWMETGQSGHDIHYVVSRVVPGGCHGHENVIVRHPKMADVAAREHQLTQNDVKIDSVLYMVVGHCGDLGVIVQ